MDLNLLTAVITSVSGSIISIITAVTSSILAIKKLFAETQANYQDIKKRLEVLENEQRKQQPN